MATSLVVVTHDPRLAARMDGMLELRVESCALTARLLRERGGVAGTMRRRTAAPHELEDIAGQQPARRSR